MDGALSRLAVAVLATAAFAIAPAGASASSLVYIKDGNVWLGSPDGSVERPLTQGGGFDSPSQADDGTVVAIERGEADGVRYGLIHRISRKGQGLGSVRCGPENSTTYSGPLGAEVSRDGALVAFHYTQFPSPSPTAAYCPTDSDALTSGFGEIGGAFNPSWISDDPVVLFTTSGFPNVITDTPNGNSEGWFTENSLRLDAGAVDRGLTKLAGIVSGGGELRLYEMTGPPPAEPTARCSFTFPGASDQYEHPTWSPDGTQLAWDEPDGIHVADVPSLADCTASHRGTRHPWCARSALGTRGSSETMRRAEAQGQEAREGQAADQAGGLHPRPREAQGGAEQEARPRVVAAAEAGQGEAT